MSIITPSDTALAYLAQLAIGQQRFDISEMSETTGHTATRLGGPPRWTAALRTLDAMEPAVSALWKAIAVQLRGRVNHLALHDITQPLPRGNGRGTMTLASTAAAGASSLALSGLRASPNLMAFGGLGADTSGDGYADGAVAYSAGSVSGQAGNITGGYQRVAVSTLGGTSSDRAGLSFAAPVPLTPGLAYSVAADMLSTAGTQHSLQMDYYSVSDAYLGSFLLGTWAGTSGWDRRSITGVAPTNAVKGYLYLYMHSASVGSPELYVDSVQAQQGAAPTAFTGFATLLAGDWLQIGAGVGSHLCMVALDATANDAGAISVTIEPPLRKAFGSGAAVTWDKPRGHYKQRPDALSWSGAAGSNMVGSFAFDLMEDWTA